MAETSFESRAKALYVLGLLSVLSPMIETGYAFEFKVGGSTGKWQVPCDCNAAVCNQWAEKNKFQVGDTLLFVYSPDQDSVLQVTKEDYTNCKTSSPLQEFKDGHTVYKLNQSGPHYFISGAYGRCQKNEKLIVVVLAQRNTQPPSPTPPPSNVETKPAAAPSEESSPDISNGRDKNGGSCIVSGGVGVFAASVASLLALGV